MAQAIHSALKHDVNKNGTLKFGRDGEYQVTNQDACELFADLLAHKKPDEKRIGNS